jgi:hypothetical protein
MQDFRSPLAIAFVAKISDDPELTCVVCWTKDVSHEFVSQIGGRRSTHGIHEDCARSLETLGRPTATTTSRKGDR